MTSSKLFVAAFAGLALAGCDLVAFPGASPRDDAKEEASERPVPPPPVASVNDQETTASSESESLNDRVADTEPVTSDGTQTTPGADPVGQIDPTIPGITDLSAINAARCAPTTEETLTIAELTGARAASANVTAQAVNGDQAVSAQFPGIVKMEPRRELSSGGISSGHCGATRIAENWFVTASHCLDNTYDEIRLIATEAGLSDPRAVTFEATASICHAAYGGSQGQYANDVALVAISDASAAALGDVPIARFGATDQALGPVNYPAARMAGWGLTGFNGELSNTLLSAELSVVTAGPAAITVASREGAGPCIGDSGGPLLVDEADGAPRVVGVLSVVEQNRATGEFCSGDYNARYTNLAGYEGWIDSVISACNADEALCARTP